MLESEESLMCLESPNGPQNAAKTFEKLESRLGSLRGRKFYGLFKEENGRETYLACTRAEEGEDPERPGFISILLPIGKYDREKLADWENNIEKIPLVFREMRERNIVDESRFSVEFYRSQKELFLMLPIK